jgi:hypothetical protein
LLLKPEKARLQQNFTLCYRKMILLASVLIPIMLLIIYVFFRTTPKHINKTKRNNYNLIIFVLGMCGSMGISLYFYFTTGKSVDSAWWPVGALFGSILIFTIIMSLGGAYRNLIYFRKKQ